MDVLNHMSPYFVPVFGFLIALFLGNLVSLLTYANRDRKVDKDLVNFRVCFLLEKILPISWRQFHDETPPSSPNSTGVRHMPKIFSKRNGSKSDVLREHKYSADCEGPDDTQSAVPLRSSVDRTTNL